MTYEVTLTEAAPFTAARKRGHTSAANLPHTISQGFDQLFAHTTRSGAIAIGPPQAAYPDPFDPEGEMEVDLLLPTDRPTGADNDIDTVQWPGGPVARTLHAGRYDQVGDAYEAVYEWINTHGHSPAGPPREIYLTGPDSTADPSGYLTEVVVPVASNAS